MTDFGSIFAAVLSFFITSISGIFLIPYLKRLKAGQTIKEIGPVWHKKKQGTPVMGGLMFIIGIVGSVAITLLLFSGQAGISSQLASVDKARIMGGILMALLFGFIGFMDDYIKVIKKRNLGLTVRQKLLLEVLAAGVFLLVRFLSGDRSTLMIVPFFDIQFNLQLIPYVILSLFIIIGAVNAVNLTDGVDGLCGSVTFVVAVAFMLCTKILDQMGLVTLSAAIAGGCLGFLVWNFHPAKIFMGDMVSFFLGGLVCALAFGMNQPLILAPLGIIYIVEALSVIIQIISFKTTGKRVFKMSPIHHHFELSGWSENKIVCVFSLITVVFSACTVAWLAYFMGMF